MLQGTRDTNAAVSTVPSEEWMQDKHDKQTTQTPVKSCHRQASPPQTQKDQPCIQQCFGMTCLLSWRAMTPRCPRREMEMPQEVDDRPYAKRKQQ